MIRELRLQFDRARIPVLAEDYKKDYDRDLDGFAPDVRARGYFKHEEFLVACAWKSPRTKPRVSRNSEALVLEATRIALSANDERIRIGALLLLDGVSWPTASVLLHFGHSDRYPILDFRALEALGKKPPANGYSFEFWWAYVEACRRLAHAARVDMRTLDRALWQWSKERA